MSRQMGTVGANPATFGPESYRNWRATQLRKQFLEHFSQDEVVGCDVIDFGCGEGQLSFLMAELGVSSVIGTEISEERFLSALRGAAARDLPIRPRFLLSRDTKRIDLPDAAADVILCFDVLEHIMDYEFVISEWHRVLRPGGRVLIWWIPWWHPYGPHIESLVPLPWAHVVFSEEVLLETCAKVYEMPEFRPRLWDLDANGHKKPNKWRAMKTLPEVNRLTMHQFESIAREVGFVIVHRHLKGFGSSKAAELTHGFLRVPRLREFFTSCVTYRLSRN